MKHRWTERLTIAPHRILADEDEDDDDIFSGDSGNSDADMDDDLFHDKSNEEVKYKVNFAAKNIDKLRIMQKDTVSQVAALLGKRATWAHDVCMVIKHIG